MLRLMERNGEEQMADAIRSAALRGAALEGGQDGLRRSDEDENSSPLADGENDSCLSWEPDPVQLSVFDLWFVDRAVWDQYVEDQLVRCNKALATQCPEDWRRVPEDDISALEENVNWAGRSWNPAAFARALRAYYAGILASFALYALSWDELVGARRRG